jgi:hypothetical protein
MLNRVLVNGVIGNFLLPRPVRLSNLPIKTFQAAPRTTVDSIPRKAGYLQHVFGDLQCALDTLLACGDH